jgi:hypothetical protein
MAQGLLGSDSYLEQWEWRDLGEREGDPAVVADEVEASLVAAYPGSQPS